MGGGGGVKISEGVRFDQTTVLAVSIWTDRTKQTV